MRDTRFNGSKPDESVLCTPLDSFFGEPKKSFPKTLRSTESICDDIEEMIINSGHGFRFMQLYQILRLTHKEKLIRALYKLKQEKRISEENGIYFLQVENPNALTATENSNSDTSPISEASSAQLESVN